MQFGCVSFVFLCFITETNILKKNRRRGPSRLICFSFSCSFGEIGQIIGWSWRPRLGNPRFANVLWFCAKVVLTWPRVTFPSFNPLNSSASFSQCFIAALSWPLLETRIDCRFKSSSLADPRGAPGMRTPPLGPFFFVFMQFGGKLTKIIGWHPLWGWRPRLGNPGPATGHNKEFNIILFSQKATSTNQILFKFYFKFFSVTIKIDFILSIRCQH